MSYGEKFSLSFADVRGNARKVSILQKDYSGSVYPLIGTGSPVVIKWDSDDDFYTPIIGSTCELNLYVTEDTLYDNWYEADEREYKVQISTGSSIGGKEWDLQGDPWQDANFLWNAEGDDEDAGYEFYWEGFLVVDRYSEAVLSKPFPIKLVASDGLGTLDGFDAPFSEVLLDSNDDPDPTAAQSNFDNLFYYLRKILENTGLDFDIRIANNIRLLNGAVNETLFHDINVFEFGLLKDNFQRYKAKELLAHILKVTNSRIFQSNGSWYIISNSNIVDKRLLNIGVPSVEDISIATLVNTAVDAEFIGNDPNNLTLTFSTVTSPANGAVSGISGADFTYTPSTDYEGTDSFTYKANNGSNDSETDATVTITIAPAAGTLTNGTFTGRFFTGDTLTEAMANAIASNPNAVSDITKYVNRLDDERTTLADTRFFEINHFFVEPNQSISVPHSSLYSGYLATPSQTDLQYIVRDITGLDVPLTNKAIIVRVVNGIILERYEFPVNFDLSQMI
tara:strand:+ start:1250 stop:2773 length:1524 start_codon:yes stop_codon:yes gene_type:complete